MFVGIRSQKGFIASVSASDYLSNLKASLVLEIAFFYVTGQV